MYNYLNKLRKTDGNFNEVLPLVPHPSNEGEFVVKSFVIKSLGEVGKLLSIDYTGFIPEQQEELFYPRVGTNTGHSFVERNAKIYAIDNSQRLLVATDGFSMTRIRAYNAAMDSESSFTKLGLARVLPSGKVDESFTLSGLTVTSLLQAEVLPDSSILLLGTFVISGSSVTGLVRIGNDGTLDRNFKYTLPFTVNSVYQFLVQKSGLIILAGNFTQDSQTRRVIRLNADGTVKESPFVTINNAAIFGKMLQTKTHLVFVSSNDTFNGEAASLITVTNKDGIIDRSFYQPQFTDFTGGDFPEVHILRNGNIVVRGQMASLNGIDMPFFLVEQGFSFVPVPAHVVAEIQSNGNVRILFATDTDGFFIDKVQPLGEGVLVCGDTQAGATCFVNQAGIVEPFGDITLWQTNPYTIVEARDFIYGVNGSRIFKFSLTGKLIGSDKLSSIPDLMVYYFNADPAVGTFQALSAKPITTGVYNSEAEAEPIVLSAGQSLKLLLLDRNATTNNDLNAEIITGKIADVKFPVGSQVQIIISAPEGFTPVFGVGERDIS